MSFNLSFVQSFVAANFRQALPLAAANLKGALPWAAGVSIATSAKGLFSGKMLPEVSKLAGKMLSSAALSVVINTAATFLPERFAILKSSNAQHAVSALSTLFVAYLFSKPSKPTLEAVLKKQGLCLVEENKLKETAKENPARLVFSLNKKTNELSCCLFLASTSAYSQMSFIYDPENSNYGIPQKKGLIKNVKPENLRQLFEKNGFKVV